MGAASGVLGAVDVLLLLLPQPPSATIRSAGTATRLVSLLIGYLLAPVLP